MFDVVKNLYSNPKFDWINEIESENLPAPIVLFNYLIRDRDTCSEIHDLSKYVYDLSAKTFILLLHTYIRKRQIPFIKKKGVEVKVDLKIKILEKLRRYFGYSVREFKYIENDILDVVGRDLDLWVKKLGITIDKEEEKGEEDVEQIY